MERQRLLTEEDDDAIIILATETRPTMVKEATKMKTTIPKIGKMKKTMVTTTTSKTENIPWNKEKKREDRQTDEEGRQTKPCTTHANKEKD